MCVYLAVGLINPPLGQALFVTCRIGGVAIEQAVRSLRPFLLSLMAALPVCTYWPRLVPFAPRLLTRQGPWRVRRARTTERTRG